MSNPILLLPFRSAPLCFSLPIGKRILCSANMTTQDGCHYHINEGLTHGVPSRAKIYPAERLAQGQQTLDTIVIGAGYAGLIAARNLALQGRHRDIHERRLGGTRLTLMLGILQANGLSSSRQETGLADAHSQATSMVTGTRWAGIGSTGASRTSMPKCLATPWPTSSFRPKITRMKKAIIALL